MHALRLAGGVDSRPMPSAPEPDPPTQSPPEPEPPAAAASADGVAASDLAVATEVAVATEAAPEPRVTVTLDARAILGFAAQQNGVAPIHHLEVENVGAAELEGLVVEIESEPRFAAAWRGEIARLKPGDKARFAEPAVPLLPDYLASRVERESALWRVVVHATFEGTPRAIQRQEWPVALQAYDHWTGVGNLGELLAAFVLPNHPQVRLWQRAAAERIAARGGVLDGYQSKSPAAVIVQTEAVFAALAAEGIGYANPPASFEQSGQKIRTPDRIAEERLATCLDLAVAAAAVLEQIGLHALIVIVEGHAFTGVWLEELNFADPLTDDGAALEKRVALGQQLLFDPTLATHVGQNFADAQAAAERHLQKERAQPGHVRAVLDVQRARDGGVRPLPLRAHGAAIVQAAELPAAVHSEPLAPATCAAVHADSAPIAPTPQGRIDRWRRRLLDLTLRNRHLNSKPTRFAVALEAPPLRELCGTLLGGDELALCPLPVELAVASDRPIEPAVRAKLLRAELAAGRLPCAGPAEELGPRLVDVWRRARVALEEGGTSGLFLALGHLEWTETERSERIFRAPLLLVPVELVRSGAADRFRLRRSAEEPRFNATLLEWLATERAIEVPGLDPLPEDASGIDVGLLLQRMRAAIVNVPRWRVVEDASFGFLTFAKFLMWKDLEALREHLSTSPVASHLIERPDRSFDGDFATWETAVFDLDGRVAPDTLACPLSADASQLTAVLAATQGKSFVLEGPPGTGKSQTIANLIAHLLFTGKSVLFVAEKIAALSVVHTRLDVLGLSEYCLELHSDKTRKADVARALGTALDARAPEGAAGFERAAHALGAARAALNGYARALHEVAPCGWSARRALDVLSANADAADVVWRTEPGEAAPADLAAQTPEAIDAAREVLARGRHGAVEAGNLAAGGLAAHPLRGVGLEDAGRELETRLRDPKSASISQGAPGPASGARTHRAEPVGSDLLESGARTAREALTACATIAADLGVELGAASRAELAELSAALRAIFGLSETERVGAAALLGAVVREGAAASDARVRGWCTLGSRRDALAAELAAHFSPALKTADVTHLGAALKLAQASWGPVRWWRARGPRRTLAALMGGDTTLDLDVLSEAIAKEVERRALDAQLLADGTHARARVGELWRDGEADWDSLVRLSTWASAAARDAGELASAVVASLAKPVDPARSAALERASAALHAFECARADLARALELDADHPWRDPTAKALLEAFRPRAERMAAALPHLRTWALWRRRRRELLDAGLAPLAYALDRGELLPKDLEAAFERALASAVLEHRRAAAPELGQFLRSEHEEHIKRFHVLDDRVAAGNRARVRAALFARAPRASAAVDGSELGILRREAEKKTRHLAVRRLLESARSQVQRLKPCFLMSPSSVAQYLAPGAFDFDVVVFDEASQIPTWDAIGAIARGRQAIVVGDSKQLPPTRFFERTSAADIDEDDVDLDLPDELESVLDEARAAGLPRLGLEWHYRSQHESLIHFSNRRYYEGKLATFPSAASSVDNLGLALRHVHGVYDRARTRTNPIEAEAVVAEIARRFADPELSRRSIGVVTFSSPQQKLVEDLLDALRRERPEFERFFHVGDDNPEAVFVKNLENVQGDERDAILFSICYGPDRSGRTAMNFGPLNQAGGERRLNVAVTRARRELIVFTSLSAPGIDQNRTRARGVLDLKAFLDFAERGPVALEAEVRAARPTPRSAPLEDALADALRARGHHVETQVGCGGFRVDIAVRDPDAPGTFVLGIGCDGANYRAARTARDRDRLRAEVLERLGWRLERVWSQDFMEQPQRELERLERAIAVGLCAARLARVAREAAARQRAAVSASADPEAVGESREVYAGFEGPEATAVLEPKPEVAGDTPEADERALDVPGADAPRYRAWRSKRPPVPRERFYEPWADVLLGKALLEVVEAEGPILFELAAERVARACGFGRVTQKAIDRIARALARVPSARTLEPSAADSDVATPAQGDALAPGRTLLWPRDAAPSKWTSYRVPGDGEESRRDAEHLPLIEIEAAALELLAASGACPIEPLLAHLRRLFGFQALGRRVRERLELALAHLVATGRVRALADGRLVR